MYRPPTSWTTNIITNIILTFSSVSFTLAFHKIAQDNILRLPSLKYEHNLHARFSNRLQYHIEMRLLKTGPYGPGQEKLEVIEVSGQDVPPYAILSHRWSVDPQDEVLLADILNETSHTKPAYAKLRGTMHQACSKDGWQYLWVDTCCIDKSSSVELSEAINSMYMYYQKAQKCYVYLFDVLSEEDFAASSWWDRGWTLQELLAPSEVEFYTKDWLKLGSKIELCQLISRKTRIDAEYLTGSSPVQYASVAKRMSWAASRKTTRGEDLAYCLMGLFDVNMAMLYGEGAVKAFLRLQEEIMKSNEDQSLFAWVKSDSQQTSIDDYHGLLADSPQDFKHARSIIGYTADLDLNPVSMTARGVHLSMTSAPKYDGTIVATLSCPVPGRGYNDWLAIYLRELQGEGGQYARVNCGKLASISELGRPCEVYVRQNFTNYHMTSIYPHHFFHIQTLSVASRDPKLDSYRVDAAIYDVVDSHEGEHFPIFAKPTWSRAPLIFKIKKVAGEVSAAILVRRTADDEKFVLLMGSNFNFEVGFNVCEQADFNSFKDWKQAFSPIPEGTQMKLKYHDVCVKVKELIRRGQKIYNVTLEIKATPLPQALPQIVQDVINPLEGKSPLSSFRNRLKQFLPKT